MEREGGEVGGRGGRVGETERESGFGFICNITFTHKHAADGEMRAIRGSNLQPLTFTPGDLHSQPCLKSFFLNLWRTTRLDS